MDSRDPRSTRVGDLPVRDLEIFLGTGSETLLGLGSWIPDGLPWTVSIHTSAEDFD